MKISIIIPTLNAEEHLPTLIKSLNEQTIKPLEIIIIDSKSTDQTISLTKESDCKAILIKRSDFLHGTTPYIGAKSASGNILVFLTQDAIPVNNDFILRLTDPIQQGKIVAAYARQIPYSDANPIETFSRKYNYPESSIYRTLKDNAKLGIKNYFFSNSAAAYDRDMFWELGGFAEDIIAIEDMDMCAKLLQAGHTIAYVADSIVFHSHNLSLSQLFRRYFDTGVYHNQRKELLEDIDTGTKGKEYIIQAMKYLLRNNHYIWLPRLFIEVIVKWVAFNCGYKHKKIPWVLKRKLSSMKTFWEGESIV